MNRVKSCLLASSFFAWAAAVSKAKLAGAGLGAGLFGGTGVGTDGWLPELDGNLWPAPDV